MDKIVTFVGEGIINNDNVMKRVSYALGMGIGQQIKNMGAADIDVDAMAQAVRDILENKQPEMTHREAQSIVTRYFKEKEAQLTKERQEKGRQAKIDGEKFLAENAKREGVVTTKSGLQYKVLRNGTGRRPKADDTVRCHYEGMLIDGTLFDSSVGRGEPADFPLNGVIAGWTEGLQLMNEGAKYRFFIPYLLGYGESGAGNIPPFSTLIFDVELIKIFNHI